MLSLLILAVAVPCATPKIHDGDNIRCAGVEMRIARIDAAEMPGSPRCRPPVSPRTDCDVKRAKAARAALRQLVRGKRVTVELVDASPFIPGFQDHDRHGRPVVRVTASGIDVGAALLTTGKVKPWP